jgi:hypothetical protein
MVFQPWAVVFVMKHSLPGRRLDVPLSLATVWPSTLLSKTVRSSRYLLFCSPAIVMRAARERTAADRQCSDVHVDIRTTANQPRF